MMNVDSDKPRYIECIYEGNITFDLEELDIDWDDVKDYWVKHGILHVDFKNGDTKTYWDMTIGEPDYKWAVRESILTEDWDLVEGLN
jgi:hypothetical protein